VRNIVAVYFALSELHGIYAWSRGDAPHFVRRLPLAFIFPRLWRSGPTFRMGRTKLHTGLIKTNEIDVANIDLACG